MEQFEYSSKSSMVSHNKPLRYRLYTARVNTDNFIIEDFQHRDWAGIPHETFCHCVVLYLVIHFTRTFDLLIEQFQHRDWIGILHETFCHCVVLYFSDSFHKNVDFLIEQFQDRDWIGIPRDKFVIVEFYMLVIHFTRALTFQGHWYFVCVRLALVLFVRYY